MCFNWKDETATTSRYVEALAIGMIPFVWRQYDKNNTYNIDPWQRIEDFDDLNGNGYHDYNPPYYDFPFPDSVSSSPEARVQNMNDPNGYNNTLTSFLFMIISSYDFMKV